MASPTGVTVSAGEPEYWPVGVDGSRRIEAEVEDGEYPDLRAYFNFGFVPTLAPSLIGFSVQSFASYRGSAADLPLRRWEKVARAAAEQRLIAAGPHGQHVDPASLARDVVFEKYPELKEATRGNALRRRNGLLHLAQMHAEYKNAEWSGVENPTQALADTHGVTAATVRGWLYRARREGLAPESSHPNATPRG